MATSRPLFLATSQLCVERSTIIIPIIMTGKTIRLLVSWSDVGFVHFVVMYGSFHTTVGPVYLHDTPLSKEHTDTSTSILCRSKLTCSATKERLADTGSFELDPDDLLFYFDQSTELTPYKNLGRFLGDLFIYLLVSSSSWALYFPLDLSDVIW